MTAHDPIEPSETARVASAPPPQRAARRRRDSATSHSNTRSSNAAGSRATVVPGQTRSRKSRGSASIPNVGAATRTSDTRGASPIKGRRRRRTPLFPASTFEDALTLAEVIQREAGDKIRRLTLFESLDRSPDSGQSRQLVTNSSKYGLTQGGYTAEYLELTPNGRAATDPDTSPRDRLRAQFNLAIAAVPPFKALYDAFKDKKLPSHAVLRDFLKESGLPDTDTQQAVDTFILNAKFLGLLRTIGGAERLLSIEHVLDDIPLTAPITSAIAQVGDSDRTRQPRASSAATQTSTANWAKVCFYVTPIGSADSEERKHSDLFLSALVEPAVQEFALQVIRADQIGKPGMITGQVIEHLMNAALVIADLSFHNPNVFYEVALRHASRKPIVQIIRQGDQIPFDLDQLRTIRIDTTDIYTLVPRIETYRSEIANQVRRSLAQMDDADNPLTVFYPRFWDIVGTRPS